VRPTIAPGRHPQAFRGIYVRRSTVAVLGEFNPLNPGQALGGAVEVLGQRFTKADANCEDPSAMLYLTTIRFTYRHVKDPAAPDAETDPVVAEVEAEFACEYTQTPADYTQQEAEVFGARPVISHVWPYWRELLHASLGRMSLPPAVMPPLILGLAAEQPPGDPAGP
jgi:hypothetical protein